MNTLVGGLGNPILGDDGIGWQIAQELQQIEKIPSNVTIECMAVGGISLMEALTDYDQAILIDAIVTCQVPVGNVNCCKLEDIPNMSWGHMSCAHDASLIDALAMGRSLGAHLPSVVWVVSVEIQRVYEFSDTLSKEVSDAIPQALQIIQNLLIESAPEHVLQIDNKIC